MADGIEKSLEKIADTIDASYLGINGELDIGITDGNRNYLLGLVQTMEELRDQLIKRNEIEAQRNELIKVYLINKFKDDNTIEDVNEYAVNKHY